MCLESELSLALAYTTEQAEGDNIEPFLVAFSLGPWHNPFSDTSH